MDKQIINLAEVHPIAGVTAERMAELAGPLGWGDACRLLKLDEAVAAARTFDLFAELDDAELTEVAKLAYECRWSAGVELFHEREEARNFCLLLEGQVALEMDIRLGPHSPPRRATVEFLKPGSALGWSSLVAPFIYTKTAIAVQPTRALCLDSQALRNLMRRHPRLGMLVMDKIAALIASRLEHQSSMLLYFLSIISHELRAPLAAVENYLQVILSGYTGPLSEEQQTMLERSVLRLEETSGLITGVLDLVRMQPEQIQQAFEPVDLHEVITEAVEDVQLGLKQKGMTLTLDVPPQLPQIIAAHGRLRQVLTNLLSNSIKFSPTGSRVWLVVRVQAEAPSPAGALAVGASRPGEAGEPRKGREKLRLEVIDQGMGIPRDELDRIFEAFYRTHGAADTAGLGLGLSIVKRIVDAHRGRIWAESPYPPEGRGGSRFVVELPIDPNQW